MHQDAPNCTIFSKFSREAYDSQPPSIMCATIILLFLYENSHFIFENSFNEMHQS